MELKYRGLEQMGTVWISLWFSSLHIFLGCFYVVSPWELFWARHSNQGCWTAYTASGSPQSKGLKRARQKNMDGIVMALPWKLYHFWHTIFVEAKADSGSRGGDTDSASQWEEYQNHSKKRMKVRRYCYCFFWKIWLAIGRNYVSSFFFPPLKFYIPCA